MDAGEAFFRRMLAAISFCNQRRRPECGLVLYDLEKCTGKWLPVGSRDPIMGTRGTCLTRTHLYTVYTIGWNETRVTWYDTGSEIPALAGDMLLPEVVDPHSICVFDGTLLVASTGTDEIVAYRLSDGVPQEKGETFWRAGSERADVHHVNSVCTDGARVYVSAFGRSNGEHWRSAQHGFVCDATSGATILDDIFHPHSVRIVEGVTYVVESSRQAVISNDGEKVVVGGYARGLDFTANGSMLVGTNPGRRVSRSSGTVTNSANLENGDGQLVGSASLVRVAPRPSVRRDFFDVGSFGVEIYDVSVL